MTIAAPRLPPGQPVDLGRRGRTFIRQLPTPSAGAPTVILLHGLMATADLNWFPAYEPLATRAGVVAMDLRGHGRGVRSRRPFRLEDCADDVAALADALALDRFIVVGYSMGGAVAQLVWRRHGARLQGMVLCATARNFGGRSPLPAGPARFVGGQIVSASVLGMSNVARLTPPVVRRQAFDRIVADRLTHLPVGDWATSELRRNDPAAVLEAGLALSRFSSGAWIADVDVPSAVVLTTTDQLVPLRRQERLAASIPGAEVFKVVGDHGVCVNAPERFVPALVAAVQSVGARSTRSPAPATR